MQTVIAHTPAVDAKMRHQDRARFFSVGGEIYDGSRPPHDRLVTLGEAYGLIGSWCRLALAFDDAGSARVAARVAREARDLTVATAIAEDWLSAGGNADARLARLAR